MSDLKFVLCFKINQYMDWQFMPFKLVLVMHKLFVFVLNYLCRLCFIIICASCAMPYVFLFISKYA